MDRSLIALYVVPQLVELDEECCSTYLPSRRVNTSGPWDDTGKCCGQEGKDQPASLLLLREGSYLQVLGPTPRPYSAGHLQEGRTQGGGQKFELRSFLGALRLRSACRWPGAHALRHGAALPARLLRPGPVSPHSSFLGYCGRSRSSPVDRRRRLRGKRRGVGRSTSLRLEDIVQSGDSEPSIPAATGSGLGSGGPRALMMAIMSLRQMWRRIGGPRDDGCQVARTGQRGCTSNLQRED
ncbi:hypothetical protein Mp_5g08600 [Marchantia polymorpha subsp. ruderalis]|uniref:Uncharacterized protein n=2 Tax=Marchantia polymorpha TaxID=3197 RepID=A0AAF6BGB3_MARPO|nr:hypothetical protein MARPO_0086s0065 [Marchantia polymorpha]BBN11047.1 hypothetical protein Mp_5g08600 [Marchantia polymorpha subsp. ruderalis]|eukprot:PTQ33746.1 hypothetical protein MARPO_0086s0065 [Marchantia polymorpha]